MRGIGIGLVIGLLLAFILLRARPPLVASYASPVSSPVRNVEEIVWIDWEGRERRMQIHREVHI